jgi:hypothetical protein
MDDLNAHASAKKAWSLFAVSTIGMLIFAGLYLSTPKTTRTIQTRIQIVTNTVTSSVTNTLTNEVLKEVPKYVRNIVKVPAEIPPDYNYAMQLIQKMTNATYTPLEQVLFNMKDVRVFYTLDDAVKQVVSEDEVKAKFELTLRRNNVPLDPNSQNVLQLTINGFFDDNHVILNYAIECEVAESQFIFRNGDVHNAIVKVWVRGGSFGTVGRANANESLLKDVEKRAEMFANDFLSANPKKADVSPFK